MLMTEPDIDIPEEAWSGQNVVQGILRVCKKTGCGSTSLVQ